MWGHPTTLMLDRSISNDIYRQQIHSHILYDHRQSKVKNFVGQ